MEQKITKETKMEINKSIEEFEKHILKFTKVQESSEDRKRKNDEDNEDILDKENQENQPSKKSKHDNKEDEQKSTLIKRWKSSIQLKSTVSLEPCLMMPDFSHLESFELLPNTIFGKGRCGTVSKCLVDGRLAAVKVADVSKMERSKRHEIKSEMKNEAMILDYLYRMGYKYAPRLYYCGRYCSFIFYVIATKYIKGHHKKCLEDLSPKQKENLDIAIRDLHKLKIIHNDLHWNNVLFCKNDRVVILDFGFATLAKEKESISIADERDYRLT